jgi:DNA-binding XRE family transcriptional regulator
MFEIAKEARLQPHDLAKLLEVSRITVSMWFNGHSKPHRLLADRVEKLLDAIRQSVDAGELPVPHDVSRRERGHYIQKTVGKRLDAETQDN